MSTVGGYDPGHPWYYHLGGRFLFPSEIRKRAEQAKDSDWVPYDLEKILDKPEPKRSRGIREYREMTLEALARDAWIYLEQVRRLRYRRRWLGPWPDEDRDMWNDPTTAVMLKHNHLSYGFRVLKKLDNLESAQMELF